MRLEDAEKVYTKYLRRENGERYGCVVGLFNHDNKAFGWSLCADGILMKLGRNRKGDQFSRKRGRQIAIGRAVNSTKKFVPESATLAVAEVIGQMVEWWNLELRKGDSEVSAT